MKRIIVANLKMNPETRGEAERLFREIKRTAGKLRGVETVFCPPFIYFSSLIVKAGLTNLKLGAQDVFWEHLPAKGGAFTGEISPLMLKKLGVKYVIIGHSERREHLKETDEMVNKKVKAALKAGLKVILCVGEKEKKEDVLPVTVKKELESALVGVSKKMAENLIIAYEPIWAISAGQAGQADKPEDVFEKTIYIRRILFDIFGQKLAYGAPILYGGSVNEKNAKDFLAVRNVSGLLVGGASLNAKKFGEILKQAAI
ncbi:MAG: triose-phosphate isomerase [Candidatus Niyogibacteria bacterium]|nr:triose-phosphate isomerase [Candidatus Niyogibacteria bacterium]